MQHLDHYIDLFFWLFVIDTLLLAWVGGNQVKYPFYELGQFCTFFYFFYIIVLLPLVCKIENRWWSEGMKKKK